MPGTRILEVSKTATLSCNELTCCCLLSTCWTLCNTWRFWLSTLCFCGVLCSRSWIRLAGTLTFFSCFFDIFWFLRLFRTSLSWTEDMDDCVKYKSRHSQLKKKRFTETEMNKTKSFCAMFNRSFNLQRVFLLVTFAPFISLCYKILAVEVSFILPLRLLALHWRYIERHSK